jgi:hypothetical protein
MIGDNLNYQYKYCHVISISSAVGRNSDIMPQEIQSQIIIDRRSAGKILRLRASETPDDLSLSNTVQSRMLD